MGVRDNHLFTVFVPALRELRRSRRPPEAEHQVFRVPSTDGVDLFCTRLGSNADAAVVVAHAAIGRSYQRWILDLAEELARSFTVILFDFRGHGLSTGRCPLGFVKPSEDLEAVVDHTHGLGFEAVGVAGFSLGAAAGFLLAARRGCIDALVSIGCPPAMLEKGSWAKRPWTTTAALRVMGMRAEWRFEEGPTPAEVAALLPPIPKLLYFGEWEVASPAEIESFCSAVASPREVRTVPGVWHADLGGREPEVREWLQEALLRRGVTFG